MSATFEVEITVTCSCGKELPINFDGNHKLQISYEDDGNETDSLLIASDSGLVCGNCGSEWYPELYLELGVE